MEDNVFMAKVLLTGLIAAGTTLWGWFGWMVILWIGCMVLDYLSGSLAATKQGEWNSKRAREGLWNKSMVAHTGEKGVITKEQHKEITSKKY